MESVFVYLMVYFIVGEQVGGLEHIGMSTPGSYVSIRVCGIIIKMHLYGAHPKKLIEECGPGAVIFVSISSVSDVGGL